MAYSSLGHSASARSGLEVHRSSRMIGCSAKLSRSNASVKSGVQSTSYGPVANHEHFPTHLLAHDSLAPFQSAILRHVKPTLNTHIYEYVPVTHFENVHTYHEHIGREYFVRKIVLPIPSVHTSRLWSAVLNTFFMVTQLSCPLLKVNYSVSNATIDRRWAAASTIISPRIRY